MSLAAGRRGRRGVHAALLLLLCVATSLAGAALPDFDAVRASHRPSDVELLDRHGEPIQALRVDTSVRRLGWVPLGQVSPALRETLIRGEDRRFWEHGGIDWAAALRSLWANAARTAGGGGSTAVQGASTLSMQVAALLEPELARPGGGRSIGQKWTQAMLARELESRWTKAQIVEAYLNLVPWRGEARGIAAASHGLFGKHPSGLDDREAAVLTALLRSPNAPAQRVAQRACALLRPAVQDCEPVASLTAAALARRPPAAAGEALAPHFAHWWRAGGGGRAPAGGGTSLRTSLDARVQRMARTALRTQLAELAGRQVEDGAVVVLDNASGEVLAWVGSSGPGLSEAPEVDGVLARRQPGSALKPFVYALAFDQGLLTPASLLLDAQADLDGGAGAFVPRNYDGRHRGWVSARTALAASLNVPAVRVGSMLGPERLFDRLQSLGLRLAESGGWHGPALPLGTADVALLDLANAYRALARGGRWTPVTGTPGGGRAAAPRTVFGAAAAFQVADVLSDAAARAPTFGLDSPLVTRGWAAVKTGTSQDMRDNWCAGFTDRYTVGVWVGNASGEAMHQVSGTTGAAPVWRQVVAFLHRDAASRAPMAPAGLQRTTVRFDPPLEPERPEWLRPGRDAATVRLASGDDATRVGVAQPRRGSIFALDPDMPASVQRIVLRGEAGQWWLDGQPVGIGERVEWAPWPGRHRVELKAADGRVIGRTEFEVRGAALRTARR